MNYTNIEQSKKLLELGLNPKSADMYFMNICPENGKTLFGDVVGVGNADISNNDLPCWSVGALMVLLPNEYPYNTCIYKTHKGWCCDINAEQEAPVEGMHYEYPKELIAFYNETIIDSLYQMIVWLLENGYIKN